MGGEYRCCGIRFSEALGKYGCPNCGGDNVAVLVKKAKPANWQDRRAMSAAEYLTYTAALGLNTTKAARWLNTSYRTALRYGQGKAEVPVPTVLLLRACVAKGITPRPPPRPGRPPAP